GLPQPGNRTLTRRRNGDSLAIAVRSQSLDETHARIGLRESEVVFGDGADHPTHALERERRNEVRVGDIAVQRIDAFVVPAAHRHGAEIDAQYPQAPVAQQLQDGAAVPPQTENDDIHLLLTRLRLAFGLARGVTTLEDAQGWREDAVETVRIEDHVDGCGDGDEPDQRHQADRLLGNVAEGQTHGHEDERELADLRNRQSGKEAGALAITHPAHDGEHDERISDQHEQRQQDGRSDVGTQQVEVE